MQINSHWFQQTTKIPSPNSDDRPSEKDISLLVLHCISLPPGQFGGDYIKDFFCNELNSKEHAYFNEIDGLKVSAHVLIKRCGKIIQFVPFNKRAWHAGISEYKGREKCNDFSIGIELEGTEIQEYTEEQYMALCAVTKSLVAHYPQLSLGDIVGHCDIAPGRKSDPGESFDWGTFFSTLR
jgi:AmpD protein